MVVVLTADQLGSRSRPDGVPLLLRQLDEATTHPPLRPFQRTAGDEVQAVVDDATTVVELLGALLRAGDWHVGLGLGATEQPLPQDARAGRGPAYLAAREAVTRAKSTPHRIRVVGGNPYRSDHLETAVWLWAGILERRTERGWQVYDAFADGLSYDETGHRLGITQSAVSQRAQTAGIVDEQRVRVLVRDLLTEALGQEEGLEEGIQ